MPIDPALAALLAETDGANTLEGVTGSSGAPEWPKPGNHACYVTGMTVGKGVFKGKDASDAKCDFPALSVQFHYECVDVDPTSTNPNKLQWSGSFFNFPNKEKDIPGAAIKDKGQGFRIQNDKERFMGIAKCILGDSVAQAHKSFGTLIPAVLERVERQGVKAPTIMVKVESRPNKQDPTKAPYLNEWGVSALSS